MYMYILDGGRPPADEPQVLRRALEDLVKFAIDPERLSFIQLF